MTEEEQEKLIKIRERIAEVADAMGNLFVKEGEIEGASPSGQLPENWESLFTNVAWVDAPFLIKQFDDLTEMLRWRTPKDGWPPMRAVSFPGVVHSEVCELLLEGGDTISAVRAKLPDDACPYWRSPLLPGVIIDTQFVIKNWRPQLPLPEGV